MTIDTSTVPVPTVDGEDATDIFREAIAAAEATEEPAGPAVSFDAIDNFMTACGLGPDDQVQKIEITQSGVLVTCVFTVDGKSFTVDTPEKQQSPLVYYRAFAIERPELIDGEHVHEDGTVHSHVPAEAEEL